jgi:hypothetical protein
VEQVVSVQRHHDRTEVGDERRPGHEPEVRVDDVEPLPAIPAAELACGGGVAAQPGREREQLDLDIAAPPQRLHLVAHERPALRLLGRRPEVRDDEGSHGDEPTRHDFFTNPAHRLHLHA